MKHKIIIAGSRKFTDFKTAETLLSKITSNKTSIEIVSGCAEGADRVGELFALKNRYPIKRFPANWRKYKKAAGPIRNKEMAEYANFCIVFWDGESRGAKDMIRQACQHKLKTLVYIYPSKRTQIFN